MSRYLGYVITPGTPTQSQVTGTAQIHEETVTHWLSPVVMPPAVCDVGKDENHDLVWISEQSPKEKDRPPMSYIPQVIREEESEVLTAENQIPRPSGIMAKMRQLKPIWFIACGAAAIFTALALFIFPDKPLPEPPSTSEPTQAVVPTEQSAEDAAITFVASQEVAGLPQLSDTQLSSLKAHIMSESGEMVLVEVSSESNNSVTTVATLLLQKDHQTWRIRQVYN